MFDFELLVLFIILSLITFRLTYMVVREDGTFGMFKRLRDVMGVRTESVTQKNEYGADIQVDVLTADHTWGLILTCFKCCSVWVSMFPALYLVSRFDLPYPEQFGWWVVFTLALSGMSIQFKRGI